MNSVHLGGALPLQNKQVKEQQPVVRVDRVIDQSLDELQILGKLVDELYKLKEKKESYCCKVRNLLHVFQGVLEMQGIDVGKKIEEIVKMLDAGIDESNWTILDKCLLDMYRIVFLFC